MGVASRVATLNVGVAMTVDEIWGFVRRHALLLFLAGSVGLWVGGGVYLAADPVYVSTAKAVVLAGNPQSVPEAISAASLQESKAKEYASLVRSAENGTAVARALGLDESGAAIAGSLSAAVEGDGSVLLISASAADPERARLLADAAVAATGEAAAALERRGLPEGSPVATLTRVVPLEPAVMPSRPAAPVLLWNLVAGAAGALLLAVAFAVVRRVADRRVRTAEDVEEVSTAGVIGVIPLVPELKGDLQTAGALGAASESFRTLRTNLQFVDVDAPPRSIVVTSAHQGDGKSSVAINLARVLALAGTPTVLVDCDLRRPRIAPALDLDDAVGLTDVLAGRLPLSEAIQVVGEEGLEVLVAGRVPPNPSELLGSRRMRALIETLSREHTVIIDAPPLLPVIDAGILSAQADGAITVLRVGSTFKDEVVLCERVLDRLGATTLGYVLNAASLRRLGEVLYGYGHGGYLAYEADEPAVPAPRAPQRATAPTGGVR